MKRFILFSVILLGIGMMVVSCQKEKNPRLVGKWGCYQILWTHNSKVDECDPADPSTQLVFEADGKMYAPMKPDNKSNWYTKDNNLYMNFLTTEFAFSDDNHMTIKYSDDQAYAHVEYYRRVN